uniref:Uncharacterized protein n=1 Tax=Rhizophora mucronata TaxID=61149 RepID=A0A2P2NLR9_RHIMU
MYVSPPKCDSQVFSITTIHPVLQTKPTSLFKMSW